jgi:hypothetical protein
MVETEQGVFVFLPPAGHQFYEGMDQDDVEYMLDKVGKIMEELNFQRCRSIEPGVWYDMIDGPEDDPDVPRDVPLEVKGAWSDDPEKVDKVTFSSAVGDWLGTPGDPRYWRMPK